MTVFCKLLRILSRGYVALLASTFAAAKLAEIKHGFAANSLRTSLLRSSRYCVVDYAATNAFNSSPDETPMKLNARRVFLRNAWITSMPLSVALAVRMLWKLALKQRTRRRGRQTSRARRAQTTQKQLAPKQ